MTPAVADFWRRFCAASGADRIASFYEAFHFDDNRVSADELAALVLADVKRATAALAWTFEHEGRAPPAPGALSAVLLRPRMRPIGRERSADMPVLCERFHVVYIAELPGQG